MTVAELVGGASPPDAHEANERREAWRRYDREMAEFYGTAPRLRDRDGMRCDPHPHDARPTPPALAPDRLAAADDPTGRRRHELDPSPHVHRTVRCTWPGCAVVGVWIGRAETFDRLAAAGAFRCADHPLDPDALDDTPPPAPAGGRAHAL